MLKPEALANGFAGATTAIYIVLFLLNRLAPPFFKLFFNSQYLGADVSSQIAKISLINFLGSLIAVALACWIFGYLVAVIYNKFSNHK